ncbi:large subunit of alpha-aminoadipate reductase [Nowakowskiella sp. JEL0078]|nr:large subunit of alpha-aminoadipate reductase [Nowakowskiella sp. JEL0078]
MTELVNVWKQKLSGLTDLLLPTDYPRPIPARFVEAEQTLDLEESTALAILKLSLALSDVKSEHRPTSPSPFSVLLTAFVILLHRHAGEEDITVGSSSRSSNPLILRFNVSSQKSFKEIFETVVKTESEAASEEIPFSTLLDALTQETSEGEKVAPSLFKVRFFNLTDTTPETLFSTTASSSCDLTIFISQQPTLRRLLPIQIKVSYNSILFSEHRIRDTLKQLGKVIETASQDINFLIGKISLLTDKSTNLIPNPKDDLHWGSFEGAITDIFHKNANSHPDRVCVVESRLDANGVASDIEKDDLRQFSYCQIDQASNIVAHHLIRNGIKREDVVVLYSYRGVDLVVAVMGVLKAGATFSVIDPAYPPSRQIVYLSVALPRGLVILKKAGFLDESVRNYIKNELEIVCEIPALEILDKGNLVGGILPTSNTDVLEVDQQHRSLIPGVTLGPDSIGTLSFTSGSTGTPKGVRGRHFSLTHFYPWMSQEFSLDERERFTMLSGIAHDPIQRDIFTPLFLGAQLRIPTAEDIGSPGRLAKWMSHHKITITHLTPAMGQLLSANATEPIPTLRNAFFVGDVLTKRDVLRLQHLAQNCHIINMYGTTETQRAVSYYRIPPSLLTPGFLSEQKDIMPAGRGMKNVQLIVMNSSGLLCGVGEVGELYVRSGGLAEGYLKLDDVTKEKFILNPFNIPGPSQTENNSSLLHYKGPRDRMYRTGDLGRYRPDGSVECSGRADDQVKIRGFRIELGEIDTHLSQHSKVRENVTLVRRDKYEEKTLVSYFVPLEADSNINELVKDIRDYLKQKLPSYAVPSVFVPLSRMPLTPNGKVDKNALPFPDTALSNANVPKSETNKNNFTITEQTIFEIWAKILNSSQSSIGLDDNFFDIGGHSILATKLVFEIRNVLSVEAALGIVYKAPTVRSMSNELDRISGLDLNISTKAVSVETDTELSLSETINSQSARKITSDKKLTSKKSTAELIQSDSYDYGADVELLDDPKISAVELPLFKFPSEKPNLKFFVTGVTGFLGAFIVSSLFHRFPQCHVICHVRASSEKDAVERVIQNGKKHLVWNEEWITKGQISAVPGDLAKEKLGIEMSVWNTLSEEVDIIIHNGALVHWIYPYHKLRAPNVLSTIDCLRLATTHHLKPLHFVSSTSALDTEFYVKLAENGPILESDDLEGARRGLNGGYGQSKWVAEKLLLNARKRGIPATIVRPGYILGDTRFGVTNGDDFLWRLVKGCIQLGKIPRIANIINMCPVDYVAGCIVSVAAQPEAIRRGVFHIWNCHSFRFDDFFSYLPSHGYSVTSIDYIQWRTALMDLTLTTNDNALFPLLHFVLDDLPTSTKAPELDDINTRDILNLDNAPMVICPKVTATTGSEGEYLSLCMGYLLAVGFLPVPNAKIGESVGSIDESPTGDVPSDQKLVQALPNLPEWRVLVGQVLGRRN